MILSVLLFFFIFYIYKVKFGTIVNPISFYCLGFLISILSVIIADSLDMLRGSESESARLALYYYDIALVVFILPWVNFPKKKCEYVCNDYERVLNVTHNLVVVLFLLLLLAFFSLGGTPILNMYLGKLDITEYNILIKQLPLGSLALITVLSYIIFLYTASFIANKGYYRMSKIRIVSLIIFCILLSIWQGKRQGLLLFIFILLVRLYFKKQQDLKKNIPIFTLRNCMLLGIFWIVFNLISSIRNGYDSVNYFELLQYSFYPVMNFASIIDVFSPLYTNIFPSNVLYEILPNRFHATYSSVDLNYLFEPTSPSGYYSYWYLDYGLWGIILGALFMSLIAKKAYDVRFKSETNLRIYILILWCCITVCIYSHLLANLFLGSIFLLLFFQKYIVKIRWRN